MQLTKRRLIVGFIFFLITCVAFLGRQTTGVWADALTLAQTVQAGQTANYQLEIYNESSAQQAYTLTLTGFPAALSASFTQGGPILATVTVAAGGYGLVNLRVDVPVDTPIGHYVATLTALRTDGTTVTNPVSLIVENTYALQIVSQTANLSTFSGQEFTFSSTAANAGAAPVTNLTLLLDTPAKWVVQSDPSVVANLEPGAEAAFAVKVLVPASQVAIDQPVHLTLRSDQTISPASTLTVRVQKSPTFLYGAALLIGLAIAGVFVYFRAKGRR